MKKKNNSFNASFLLLGIIFYGLFILSILFILLPITLMRMGELPPPLFTSLFVLLSLIGVGFLFLSYYSWAKEKYPSLKGTTISLGLLGSNLLLQPAILYYEEIFSLHIRPYLRLIIGVALLFFAIIEKRKTKKLTVEKKNLLLFSALLGLLLIFLLLVNIFVQFIGDKDVTYRANLDLSPPFEKTSISQGRTQMNLELIYSGKEETVTITRLALRGSCIWDTQKGYEQIKDKEYESLMSENFLPLDLKRNKAITLPFMKCAQGSVLSIEYEEKSEWNIISEVIPGISCEVGYTIPNTHGQNIPWDEIPKTIVYDCEQALNKK